MAEEHLATLARFGMTADDEVVFQSRRTALYDEVFERLRTAGRIYPCGCSRREIAESSRAPHGPDGPRYPGICRTRDVPPGEIRAWRFHSPEGVVRFDDEILGEISQDVSAEVGDFVIRRETPEREYAYQLAVVVDDALQNVTRVVRGADLLGSTARQIALGEALDFPRPRYAHLPLLVTAAGEKLSKRAGEMELSRAIARGAEDLVAAKILRLLGQAPTLEEAVRTFDPGRIPRGPNIVLPESLEDSDQGSG